MGGVKFVSLPRDICFYFKVLIFFISFHLFSVKKNQAITKKSRGYSFLSYPRFFFVILQRVSLLNKKIFFYLLLSKKLPTFARY